MVFLKQLLCGLVASLLVVVVKGDYPCDTAGEYIEAFTNCYSGNASTYLSSITVNAIYQGLPEDFIDYFLPEGDQDSDGIAACGEGIDEIRECISMEFGHCSMDLRSVVNGSVDEFRERVCEESEGSWQFTELAKTYFEKSSLAFSRLFSNLSSGEGEIPCLFSLFSSGLLGDNSSCETSAFSSDVTMYVNTTSYVAAKDRMASIYGSYIKCLFQETKKVGCYDDTTLGFLAYMVLFTTPPGIEYGLRELDELVNTAEMPTGSVRVSVKVFGDPHVISYDGDSFLFSTCSGLGERLYLLNNFVTIRGVNTGIDGWGEGTQPSYMTEVVIVFTDSEGTTVASFSYTGGESLPSSFDVEQADSGASVEEASNSVTRIYFSRGGIVIGLKKISNTLAMTVRMSQTLYKDSIGYLVSGCLGQEIETTQVKRRKRQSDVCDNLGLVGEINAGCVYDLASTGDESVVTGQYESIAEMEAAAEELDATIIVDETTTQSSASGLQSHVATILMILIGFTYCL